MDQDRKRDQDMPNRASEMEQAEGSRDSRERGGSSETERDRAGRESRGGSNSGGITNRPLDRENCEQERLPDRGRSQSEH